MQKYSSSIASNISCEESSQSGTASSPYNRTTKEKNCKCEFDNCLVVLGGDWLWIANVLDTLVQRESIFARTAFANYVICRRAWPTPPIPFQSTRNLHPVCVTLKKELLNNYKLIMKDTEQVGILEQRQGLSQLLTTISVKGFGPYNIDNFLHASSYFSGSWSQNLEYC